MPEEINRFDAIVIGSGIGSLAAAALLARRRQMRVLVLEQHFTIGGQTHEFKRKGRYEFDVGLHYVGDMDHGEVKAAIDYLTDGRVRWQKLPDDLDRFVYPDFEFAVPSDEARYRQRLIERYPAERAAIEQYFRDLKKAARWYGFALLDDALPAPLRLPMRWAFRRCGKPAALTLKEYLDGHFQDGCLKALLASQWGAYGLPPAKSAFGMHALVVGCFLRGGWYPEGGAKQIARAIVPGIERRGGRVLSGRTVTEIIVENGCAVGVRTMATLKPKLPPVEYRAPRVISGAGAANTYLKLLPARVEIPFREALAALPCGTSAVTVYVGFKDTPEKLGVHGENIWAFDSYDHDDTADSADLTHGYFLSFASLHNRQAQAHTAQIVAFVKHGHFARWAGGRWKRRGAEYEAFKQDVARQLIAKVERRLPGFADLIAYVDVSTPLTMAQFQGNARGEFYGVPATPDRLFQPWTRVRSPVRNLYLTGGDVLSAGVMGAMMGGVKTAGVLMGPFGFFRLMGAMIREARAAASPRA